MEKSIGHQTDEQSKAALKQLADFCFSQNYWLVRLRHDHTFISEPKLTVAARKKLLCGHLVNRTLWKR